MNKSYKNLSIALGVLSLVLLIVVIVLAVTKCSDGFKSNNRMVRRNNRMPRPIRRRGRERFGSGAAYPIYPEYPPGTKYAIFLIDAIGETGRFTIVENSGFTSFGLWEVQIENGVVSIRSYIGDTGHDNIYGFYLAASKDNRSLYPEIGNTSNPTYHLYQFLFNKEFPGDGGEPTVLWELNEGVPADMQQYLTISNDPIKHILDFREYPITHATHDLPSYWTNQ